MNWIYISLIAVGFFPLLVVFYKMNKMKQMRKNGIKVTATVTSVPVGLHNEMNAVVIEYREKETGQLIEKQIAVAGNPYGVGQQLPLLYKKDNPTEIILDSGKGYIFILVFAILVAVGMIIASFMIHQAVANGEM